MYLNLDLLYNVEIYLFPLFYYQKHDILIYVYSPITKKSFTGFYYSKPRDPLYFDHITLNFCCEKPEPQDYPFNEKDFTITETEFINFSGFKYIRCNPVKIPKKGLDFLKSNTRIKSTPRPLNVYAYLKSDYQYNYNCSGGRGFNI